MMNLLRAPKYRTQGPRSRIMAYGMGMLCGAFSLAVLCSDSAAQKLTHSKQHLKYQRCMALSKSNPDAAFDMALSWQDFGGGDAAGHCVATALMGLKIYNEAALRLETLAQSSQSKTNVRSEMLAQAAQAWLLDGNLDRAESVLTTALELRADDPNLLVDRAVIFAEKKNFNAAVQDLSKAIKLNSTLVDGYVFRSSAYRQLKKFDEAKADIDRALRLDGNHAAGLLERGILLRLKGDTNGARQDWMKILKLAPGTPAAKSAQANLEKMDVKKP